MFKRILVAVDGSRHSLAATALAVEVASRSGALVEALFVKDSRIIHAPYWRDFGAISLPTMRFDNQLEAFFQQRGEAVLATLKERYPQLEGRIAEGRVDEVIQNAARGADLLVLGSAGESHEETSDVEHLGSRVLRIIRRVRVPTLVVPDGELSLQRVRVAFTGDLTERVVAAAKSLADSLRLPLEVIALGDDANGRARPTLGTVPLRQAPGDPLEALPASCEPGDLIVVSGEDFADLESAIPNLRVPVIAYL